MLAWLSENLATVIICAALIAAILVLAFIVYMLFIKKYREATTLNKNRSANKQKT